MSLFLVYTYVHNELNKKNMNINNRLNRLTIVDKQYKLRQLFVENNKSVVQFSRKFKPIKKSAKKPDQAA
ncbi:hypothetical protein H1P_3030004 [Hyella patelloides LEGE 07179]|uniref:Uncharacterized protein n=2 Tax=Hyella TaxID=945733 RepID=A0A563VUW1_9CYAN|nr:hypothetical protein H1P_3030004 [Hyella patelloides LEGE 07179]